MSSEYDQYDFIDREFQNINAPTPILESRIKQYSKQNLSNFEQIKMRMQQQNQNIYNQNQNNFNNLKQGKFSNKRSSSAKSGRSATSSNSNNTQVDLGKKLDEEFVLYMLEIEQRYQECGLNKQEKLRVEQWSKTLCQVSPSLVWKRNRNLYTMLLLNQIVSFNKLLRKEQSCANITFQMRPPENGNHLPTLSKTEVQSQLTKKFKDVTTQFKVEKIKERLLSPD